MDNYLHNRCHLRGKKEEKIFFLGFSQPIKFYQKITKSKLDISKAQKSHIILVEMTPIARVFDPIYTPHSLQKRRRERG